MGSKYNNIHWDTVNLEYPVKKFPPSGETSSRIGHEWRDTPEVLLKLTHGSMKQVVQLDQQNLILAQSTSIQIHHKEPKNLQEFEYTSDTNIRRNLNKSQTKVDFEFKQANIRKINKHTSCIENEHLYPCSTQLENRPLRPSSHTKTEHQDKFTKTGFPSTLVTDKNQHKHCFNVPDYHNEPTKPSWHKELPPLDTTYEGFEKYLDPYLSTNRLHHRPFTSEQTKKQSGSRGIITYYTLANIPWIHTPKPVCNEWHKTECSPKQSMFDREKFKQDCREIIVHNKHKWVSGSFRTESRDNYKRPEGSVGFRSTDIEDDTKGFYKKSVAEFPTRISIEDQAIRGMYATEYAHLGSGKPLCSSLDQFVETNKRLYRNK